MLDVYRPTQLLLVMWPTAEFELPADVPEFGGRLCRQFADLRRVQAVNVQGGMAPPELPRLIVLSEDQRWGLELAPARVNLRRSAARGQTLDALLEELRAMVLPLHSWLAEQANLRVFRIGLIADLRCDTRSSASEKIMNYFLQPRAGQGSTPTEIHLAVHHRLVLGESGPGGGALMLNRWLRVQPMRTRDARRLDFAALVQIDLNSMAEDTQVKTGRDLAVFLDAVGGHLKHGIPLLMDTDFLA
jgi:hypothetical protein